jgi:hypothetical protein
MSREVTSHKTSGLNDALRIQVMDEPGHGNACHVYKISPPELDSFDATTDPKRASRLMRACCDIRFQNGPIQEVGVNGISNEALLAIVEDRLFGFQSSQFACRENAIALTRIQEAMMWLQKRTRDRTARGVEGTNQK